MSPIESVHSLVVFLLRSKQLDISFANQEFMDDSIAMLTVIYRQKNTSWTSISLSFTYISDGRRSADWFHRCIRIDHRDMSSHR